MIPQSGVGVFCADIELLETVVRLLRLLVVAGPDGIAAGSLAEQVEVSPSNVSFHLKELERSGLVTARRDASSIVYSAEYDALGRFKRVRNDFVTNSFSYN